MMSRVNHVVVDTVLTGMLMGIIVGLMTDMIRWFVVNTVIGIGLDTGCRGNRDRGV